MTAFDNIKTNNWPSTSNEFEDFLVLKLPLNDNASLTESLPVVAGSQELFPKRTLTNTGAQSLQSGDAPYASLISSTNGFNGANTGRKAFDGSLSTLAQNSLSSDNSINIDFSSNPISYSSSVRIHCYAANGYGITNTYYINNSASGTTFTGGSSGFNSSAWVTIASGSGTLNHIRLRLQRSSNQISSVGLYAVEVDGTILTDPPGGAKKYYDNNAGFSTGRLDLENSLFTADPSLSFGSGDFTIEAWVKISNTTASNPIFCGQADGTSTPGSAYIFTLDTTNGRTPRIHVGSAVQAVTWGSAFSADTWYHVAMVRDGNTLRLYRDGVQSNSAACSGAANNGSTTHKPTVGSMVFAGTRYTFQGEIQDLRVYKGLCKYPSGTTFTPPLAILG
jgi:hypothetical protein